MGIWSSLQPFCGIFVFLVKANLAKFKVGRPYKYSGAEAKVLSFFYPMTDDSKQWLKKYYILWASFSGYSKDSFLVHDSFRKEKSLRNFSIAFGFRNSSDALSFHDALENPLENLKNLGFLNFSVQDVLWQMQKIKFLFFKSKFIYFSPDLLRKELSIDGVNVFSNLILDLRKQPGYLVAYFYRLVLSFIKFFTKLFIFVIYNFLFKFLFKS